MSRQLERQAQLTEAMSNLLRNEHFAVFMDEIRDMRESAVNYMVQHDTVKDQRLYLAAVGEVRTWTDLLGVYDQARQQLMQRPAPEDFGPESV